MNKNCFAYGRANHCKVLKTMLCRCGTCRFFKTKKQYRDDCRKAEKHLETLDISTQRYIADKYFNSFAQRQKEGV